MDKKSKVLHYRCADFLQPDTGLTLQKCLKQALSKRNVVGLRKETCNQSDGQIGNWARFINTHQSAHNMEFGVLVMLEPGQNKLLIEKKEDKDEVDVSQLPPPKGKEFMEALLYYGVKDNHVVLLQSTSLRAQQLEGHLFWLLSSKCTGIIVDTDGVYLNNYAPQDSYRAVVNSPVEKVSIETSIGESDLTDSKTDTKLNQQKVDVKRTLINAGSKGLEILQSLLPIDQFNKILEEQSPDADVDLEVLVEVKRKRYRHLDDSGQDFLNAIASTMRYVDSNDLRIELADGTVLKGEKLTIKTERTFDAVDGILIPTDVFLQMSNWLTELIKSEKILP